MKIRNDQQLLKIIQTYSSLEHPVNIEDISILRRKIGQSIIICKELLKRCNNIEEAERLYNNAYLIAHLQNYNSYQRVEEIQKVWNN